MPLVRVFAILAVVAVCVHRASALNLIENPGFERLTAPNQPAAWTPLIFGVPAAFTVDEQVRRSGERSLRIEATEITRSYICTPWLAVVPGERLSVQAWVKPEYGHERGTIIAIGEFQGTRSEGVVNLGVAGRRADWQKLGKTIEVPSSATAMRVRLGFSYCKGSCWWDDVVIEPEQPIVARPDLAERRFYPGGGMPIQIVNRNGSRGPWTLRVQVDKRQATLPLELTGEPLQRVVVPVESERRGERPVRVELLKSGEARPAFAAETTALIPPPATLGPLIPTHWVLDDGPPRLDGEIELALSAAQHREAVVRLSVLDAGGREVASRPLAGIASAGFSAFRAELPDLAVGVYRVVVHIDSPDGKDSRVEQPWEVIRREQASVMLNAAGLPEIQGRPIYPMGMFNLGARIKEAAAAGLNVSHAYNAAYVYPGQRPDDQRLKDFLDSTRQNGMHALLLLPLRFATAGEWEAFRRRVRMFRNHPALLAWDEEELLARGNATMETLVKMRQIQREEDPHHPFMVGDSRGPVLGKEDRSRFFPDEQMDLGMWWWYPFPLESQGGDALAGEAEGKGLVLDPPAFLTQAKTAKPVWVGVQAYKKPSAGGRYPTPAEYRAQAYAAIAAGARGLMWYGGSVQGGLFLSPDEGHWGELKALISELRELSPFLVAAPEKPPLVVPASAPIGVTMRRSAKVGRVVVIAVHRGPTPVDVELHAAVLGAASAAVRGENRRVPVSQGRWRDRFEPLAVHIYEFEVTSTSKPAR